MITRYYLALTALLLSLTSFGQTDEIKVRFIGNCGLYMTDGTTNFYIDFPYKSGAHHYMEYDLSELDSVKPNPLFIYTHKHSDHFSGKLVRRLARKLNGSVYSPSNIDELLKLNNTIPNFKIEVFKTKHHFSINHYSYLINWHGKRIYISGDTEHVETIATIKDIDWAFMPIWLILDAQRKNVTLKDNVDMLVIYHIGPKDSITFKEPDPRVKLLTKQGEVMVIQ
jgi:L-ascorbate metabolism protein UlaG (beta-lactamase superfamily)